MSFVFGFLLLLLATGYSLATHWSKTKVKVVRKNCVRHIDEDADF